MSVTGSSIEITNCVIVGNGGDYTNGGAVHVAFSWPLLRNCTIARNVAKEGGVLYSSFGEPRLLGCIVYGNSSTLLLPLTELARLGLSARMLKGVGRDSVTSIVIHASSMLREVTFGCRWIRRASIVRRSTVQRRIFLVTRDRLISQVWAETVRVTRSIWARMSIRKGESVPALQRRLPNRRRPLQWI